MIRATFERRQTPVPGDVPMGLSPEFAKDQAKQTQWRAFVSKSKLDTGGIGLQEVGIVLRDFLAASSRQVTCWKWSGHPLDLGKRLPTTA